VNAPKIGKRALDRTLKEARAELARKRTQEERERCLAERQDPRPQIEAPMRDAPWLPEMETLNNVLGKSAWAEPPMRDIEGVYVKVHVRRAINMHAFTSAGANVEEGVKTRLPAPEQPLLTRLSAVQLAEEIERHIDYVETKEDGSIRSVHLEAHFVRHFHTRPDDAALPLAAAIATLPIVLPDGSLLAGYGLDRDRGIVFRIPEALLEIMPAPADCIPGAVARARSFLCDEWLCDVATDYAGKCVLIAAALTVIERSILPNRPTFWVTAGKRGGGKTTAIIMVLQAVTGFHPSAAAWSSNEEERRKALLAYLLEALAAIVWDNIPRGAQISCPHIERSCTTAFYSDRRLGVSEIIAVSAAVIHFFTGNNIGPKGDLASRSLGARLEVYRVDPENRSFKHPDPIEWTEQNRGKILVALFTILLGNPRLNDANPPPAETRFKQWYHLVGSPVEHAAKQHAEHVRGLVMDADKTCSPRDVRFKDLFLQQDEDDDEAASLADALDKLAIRWPNGAHFKGADVAKLANITGEGAQADDRERAMILREVFFSDFPLDKTVTARTAGRRLKRHVGAPVVHDGKTLTLNEWKDPKAPQKDGLHYYVHEITAHDNSAT
jgi:hypothetical protein